MRWSKQAKEPVCILASTNISQLSWFNVFFSVHRPAVWSLYSFFWCFGRLKGSDCLATVLDGPGTDFSFIKVPNPSLGKARGSGGNSSGLGFSSKQQSCYDRRHVLADPDQRSLLKQDNPRLSDALLSGHLELCISILQKPIGYECAFRGCKNRTAGGAISFFRFPIDPNRYKKNI